MCEKEYKLILFIFMHFKTATIFCADVNYNQFKNSEREVKNGLSFCELNFFLNLRKTI